MRARGRRHARTQAAAASSSIGRPSIRSRRPAAARPTGPTSQRASPGRAPRRSRGGRRAAEHGGRDRQLAAAREVAADDRRPEGGHGLLLASGDRRHLRVAHVVRENEAAQHAEGRRGHRRQIARGGHRGAIADVLERQPLTAEVGPFHGGIHGPHEGLGARREHGGVVPDAEQHARTALDRTRGRASPQPGPAAPKMAARRSTRSSSLDLMRTLSPISGRNHGRIPMLVS
jgi:hypothetical protein